MYKKVKSEKRTIGVKETSVLELINTYEFQRRYREEWANTLSKRILNGRFRTGDIGVAILLYDERKKVLVNGQHQTGAVKKSEKSIDVMYAEYEVSSPEELSELYRSFDVYKGRTIGDLARSMAGALGLNIPQRIISLVITSIARREGKYQETKEVKIDLLPKYVNFATFYNSILTDNGIIRDGFVHMLRGAVGHAMVLTWEKSKEDSKKFWLKVRDGEELRKIDPEYVARDILVTHFISRGRGKTATQTMSDHEMTSRLIQCWNAFREGRKLDGTKYYMDKPIPKIV